MESEIKLEDDTPFKDSYGSVPSFLIREVREHLKEMFDVGAISNSKSPFSSNVAIVHKKTAPVGSVLITES